MPCYLMERWMRMTTSLKQSLIIVSLLAVAVLTTGGKKPDSLSPHEEKVARRIGFDKEVPLLLKGVTQEPIHRMTGYDADGYQIMVDGISASVPQDKVEQFLSSIKPALYKKGYMVFIVEMNDGIKTDKIGVLKGIDQYDILRVMQTNGEGDDVSNEDVIAKLKEWEKGSSFEIIGAENDWIEIEFKKLPNNLKSFVEDLEDFCPAAVEGGAGAEEELMKEMQKTKRLYLWWE
jgi:hypothetical protein